MTTEITYAYLRGWQAVPCTWIGSRSIALEAGAMEIGADEQADGAWTYYADETRSRWRVSADDLAVYGAAVLDGRASEAYSLWCAGSAATEIL
jgi:hypothetical protein